jgi:2-amino-4-hydroxy-6-hydroxymethyldihydropteridine diphosphokinase
MATVNLILPHPRLHTRLFVLRPLADIAPDWRHPRSGEKLDDMLKKVHKAQEIRKIG